MKLQKANYLLGTTLAFLSITPAANAQHSATLDDVKQLAGCFIVDYSYSENEVVDPTYKLDPRVYDVGGFTVKELVRVVDQDSANVRLQRFMQADDFAGNTTFMMRHHAEIWRDTPSYRYEYTGRYGSNDRWEVESLDPNEGNWVREIVNLDDGLRYQCLGKWSQGHSFPRFECESFAPIPGRETRDMGRKDYNTMNRKQSVVIYGDSWLERQNNTKIQFSASGKNPLVHEVGKIWSVRIPDEECSNVGIWADERQAFWDVLADVWGQTLDGSRAFHEIKLVNGTTRGAKISELEQQYFQTIGSNFNHEQIVRQRLLEIIEAHRE
jgi:hypothetical protein